ncbi:PepSY domain-containing protein [Sphingomonas baiyangensis]|uniref:PepSY domain-containing protein n=1 Tax=Sphingomonas baiyangensis TaxID=2572576 RepID=A0A4U1L599_9SPHN|nr:PepSY domain-containing protein [Sphingomonas baiyangensis]TKD51744.1 hypothetical protein FBR43_14010 [Sphingomonas baiyangensis]
MRPLSILLAAGLLAPPLPATARTTDAPQRKGDHRAAHEARMQGRILPLREIERRVVPKAKGARYIGFDFDSGTAVYTLKFLRDGNVIWIEVDGRSGQILGRSGDR